MFYLLNKEKGISSFAMIKKFAKANNVKKIGHTGTLDPLATGLLLIATEEDTKLIEYVDKGDKTYKATIILGFTSDTFDVEGKVEETPCLVWPSLNNVIEVINSFKGKMLQVPPSFSAKKINGKKAYELARKNISFQLQPQMIEVLKIENILQISEQEYSFEIQVSRGTYIRSIVNEIGLKLTCNAILKDLKRTKIGFLTFEDLNREIKAEEILSLNIYSISKLDMISLYHGKTFTTKMPNGKYGLKFKDEIVGVATVEENMIFTKKILGKKIERLLNETS